MGFPLTHKPDKVPVVAIESELGILRKRRGALTARLERTSTKVEQLTAAHRAALSGGVPDADNQQPLEVIGAKADREEITRLIAEVDQGITDAEARLANERERAQRHQQADKIDARREAVRQAFESFTPAALAYVEALRACDAHRSFKTEAGVAADLLSTLTEQLRRAMPLITAELGVASADLRRPPRPWIEPPVQAEPPPAGRPVPYGGLVELPVRRGVFGLRP